MRRNSMKHRMARMRAGGKLPALAAVSGAVSVICGAFASHGASGQAAEWLKIGAHYQLIHAVVAIIACSVLQSSRVAMLFLAGSWIFAGTLYAMAFGAPKMLGAITPVGGGLMILGWLCLAGCFLMQRKG
jgi:uncharacterized membrane protein YgdD (TMEM256/DUF423 family)